MSKRDRQPAIELFSDVGVKLESFPVPFAHAIVSAPQQGKIFSIEPHGPSTSEDKRPISIDLARAIEAAKGTNQIHHVFFTGFETLIFSHTSAQGSLQGLSLEVSEVEHLHLQQNGLQLKDCRGITNFYVHGTFDSPTAKLLPDGANIHFVNPRYLYAENVSFKSIIGKGGQIEPFSYEAIADYVWLDVYNFPEPKDWRINIQAKKFLHVSRVLNTVATLSALVAT